MATTLAGYYTGLGKALPSLSQRASTYEQMGLGKAGEYQGTAQQNTALLGKLSSGGSSAPTTYGQAATASNGGPTSSATGGSTGQPDVNAAYAPIVSQVSDTNAQRQALLDKLSTEGDANYTELSNKIGSQENLQDAYKRIYGSTTIGGRSLADINSTNTLTQNQIDQTKQLVDNLHRTLTTGTQGTFTSKAQEGAQEASQGASLNSQISSLNDSLTPSLNAYNNAIGQVKDQVSLEQAQQEKELQPYQLKIQAFADKSAREISGFNEGAKNLLDANLAKVQSGVQLSEDEWKQTVEAALAEEGYQNAYKTAQLQAESTIKAAGITAGASAAAARVTGENEQALAKTNYQNQLDLLQRKGDALKSLLGGSSGSGISPDAWAKMTPEQQTQALQSGFASLGQ